jgi:hypothetical protein
MSNFAAELQAHLEADPNLRRRGKRILDVLKSRPSKKKDRTIARMERHAAAAIEREAPTEDGVSIDWSQIDWKKWLGIILKILLMLLPLLI